MLYYRCGKDEMSGTVALKDLDKKVLSFLGDGRISKTHKLIGITVQRHFRN